MTPNIRDVVRDAMRTATLSFSERCAVLDALDAAITEAVKAEREGAAVIAETSRFGESELGDISWREAVQRSETLCRLIAAAIRSRP